MQRCRSVSQRLIGLREGRGLQETRVREPGERNGVGSLTSTTLNHNPGFKINRFFYMRDRQIEYHVPERIILPRDLQPLRKIATRDILQHSHCPSQWDRDAPRDTNEERK